MIKLRLLKNNRKDYLSIYKFVTNYAVAEYLTWQPYKKESDIIKYFEKVISATSYPDQTLAIEYDSQVIGTVHIISKSDGCTQFGFGILPDYWNKGFGSATISHLLDYINSSIWKNKTKELWADVNKNNHYAIRILLKHGFKMFKNNISENRDRYILFL